MALNAYEGIIDQIRTSCLNYQIQMSPFSAHISLKRSLVKEKSGIPRLPVPSMSVPTVNDDSTATNTESVVAALIAKNQKLEKDLDTLKGNYTQSVDDCLEAYQKIKSLEKHSIKSEIGDVALIENLKIEQQKTIDENVKFKEKVKEQEEEIHELESRLKTKNEIVNQLNKQMNDNRIQNEKHVANIKKSHKAEVKSWRKDLGEERKEKVKLNKKLEKVLKKDHSSSVEEPEISLRMKALDNPLEADYSDCNHENQCIVRQPFPPPSPSSPFIVHEVSKYHIHMMRMTVDDLAGCTKCFSIDNENYGCDNCTWLKWWFKWHGDRHGFPDIHPSKYRKYL